MTIWIDAQLSPDLSPWITEHFRIDARAARDLGLRDAKDVEIYLAAREADAIVMTKDADFVGLLERLGPPPRGFGSHVATRRTHACDRSSTLLY